jgi:gliding motility-associated-like protein
MRLFIRIWLLLLLLFPAVSLLATHNRAGEITYEHISGFTYRIRVTTYTKQSAIADRNSLKIRWGDEGPDVTEEQLDSLFRSLQILNVGNDVKQNEYVGLHTYSGAGTFQISVEDPNRNAGVLNINNGAPGTPEAEKTSTSVMTVFAIRSTLVIRPGNDGHNNSIKFLNPPIQDACIFQPWIHNPVAYDSLEGDQLVFTLVTCLGSAALPLDTWESPVDYTDDPNDTFVMDPQTGDITWDTPLVAGEYNVAFEVREFRNGIFVGAVERDMQITVVNCANVPPLIAEVPDFCVTAGELLQFQLNYSDPNGPQNQIQVEAVGGPMTEVENVAEYNSITRFFTWVPQCEEVRLQPYYVSFIATDQGNIPLSDVETVGITVVAPPVENPVAEAAGNAMDLSWDPTPCFGAFDPSELDEVQYLIYRRNNLFGFEPDPCEVGVPEYTGYTFIGETTGADATTFTDDDVFYGGIYCYMVVTVWPDGAQSYASEEFCDTINKEIPVMTKVSIGVTDIAFGVDTIHWSKPSDLDTTLFPGPYTYQLFYGQGNNPIDQLVYETPEFEFLYQGDSSFTHENLNTADFNQRYRVEIHNTVEGQGFVAASSEASSIFLQLTPGDNSMLLNMAADVPWTNYEYRIFRKGPGDLDFLQVAISNEEIYTDTGLVNNQPYCYKVLVEGSYFASDVTDPLFNWSQEECAQPYDLTPPCPPILSIEDNCGEGINTLTWSNVFGCADDIQLYNVYYAPVQGQPLALIATVDTAEDTVYVYQDLEEPVSIAGCFAVTALDSLNLWPDGNFYRNESAFSDTVCIDNCPVYFLPNVFSPNGDDLNDLFIPFKYRYVESIDMKIYNRWGGLVFETQDPDVLWNGLNKDSGEICTDGVYYYVAKVNTIRLSGIVTEVFNGNVQLMNGKTPQNSN